MKDRLVYVDTAPFIYFMEKNPKYEKPLDAFFSLMSQGKIRTITSAMTLAEVLVKPYQRKQWKLAEMYESIFEETAELTLVSVDAGIGRLAAKLRASYSLLTPDAIHMATAMMQGAEFFLTNDKDFRKVDSTDRRSPKLAFIDKLLSQK
jgi:predicted nucleic acid-binding protein